MLIARLTFVIKNDRKRFLLYHIFKVSVFAVPGLLLQHGILFGNDQEGATLILHVLIHVTFILL